MGLPLLMGTPLCQQYVPITQSLNNISIYLNPFIESMELPFLIFILSSHTKALVWAQLRKNEVGTWRKNTVKSGRLSN